MSMASEGPHSGRWDGFLARAGRFFLYAGLVFAVVMKGVPGPILVFATCVLIGLALVHSSLLAPRHAYVCRALDRSLAVAAVLAVYVLLQSVSFAGNPFANPIWDEAQAILGGQGGSISVQPAETRSGIFVLLLPFMVYMAVLGLFQSDKAALRLIKVIAAIGLVFALFGIVQVSVAQRSLLFFEKEHYLSSLTGFFVNRNTAGTLLGVASLAMLAWFVDAMRKLRHEDPAAPDDSLLRDPRTKCIVLGIGFVIIILALFLTKSRGAVFATAVAYLAILPTILVETGVVTRASPGQGVRGRFAPWLAFLIGASAVAVVLAIFGSGVVLRLVLHGTDDARMCVYEATLAAYRDNWVFGTGFATFQDVFPAYRAADCGDPYMIFTRAHSIYLEGLAGLGLMFIPATLAVYLHLIQTLREGYRTRRRYRLTAVLGAGAVILVTMHGLIDFSLQIPGMAVFFAAFMGATTVLCVNRSPTGKDV